LSRGNLRQVRVVECATKYEHDGLVLGKFLGIERTRRVRRRVSEKSTTSLQVRVVEFATDTTNGLFTARCERRLRVQV